MTWGLRVIGGAINTFSLINEIKVVYLTGSFLIVYIEDRYSPLYYGLLLLVINVQASCEYLCTYKLASYVATVFVTIGYK